MSESHKYAVKEAREREERVSQVLRQSQVVETESQETELRYSEESESQETESSQTPRQSPQGPACGILSCWQGYPRPPPPSSSRGVCLSPPSLITTWDRGTWQSLCSEDLSRYWLSLSLCNYEDWYYRIHWVTTQGYKIRQVQEKTEENLRCIVMFHNCLYHYMIGVIDLDHVEKGLLLIKFQ